MSACFLLPPPKSGRVLSTAMVITLDRQVFGGLYPIQCDQCGKRGEQKGQRLPPNWSQRWRGAMWAPEHVCSVMCAEEYDMEHPIDTETVYA